MSNTEIIKTGNVLIRIMELEIGSSTEWHHHTEVTDHFVCLTGIIKIETKDDGQVVLLPGQRADVKPLQIHRVLNAYQDKSEYMLVQGVGIYDFVKALESNNSNSSKIELQDINNISSRDKDIYKLHSSGISNSEISKTYNISADRVIQICKKLAEYKQHYPPLKNLLSVRTQNILVKHFKDNNILEHPGIIISELTPKNLLSIKNIGRICYTEIIEALTKIGYLKHNDSWLKK